MILAAGQKRPTGGMPRVKPSVQLCYFSAAMALASSDQILQATHQWLKPLAHVLLSCGITW
jgi:hypothetical protein